LSKDNYKLLASVTFKEPINLTQNSEMYLNYTIHLDKDGSPLSAEITSLYTQLSLF